MDYWPKDAVIQVDKNSDRMWINKKSYSWNLHKMQN